MHRLMIGLSVAWLAASFTPLAAQSITGRVLAHESNIPVDNALVILVDESGMDRAEGVADSLGHFIVTAPEPGRYRIRAQRIGYTTTVTPAVDLDDEETMVVEVLMGLTAIPLAPLVVTDRARPRSVAMAGFVERRALGKGVFMDRQALQNRFGSRVYQVLRDVPGVRVRPAGMARVIPVMAGAMPGCLPQVYLDGHKLGTSRFDFLNDASVEEVEAMEIYRSIGEAPIEFQSEAACGVIVIWTRRG